MINFGKIQYFLFVFKIWMHKIYATILPPNFSCSLKVSLLKWNLSRQNILLALNKYYFHVHTNMKIYFRSSKIFSCINTMLTANIFLCSYEHENIFYAYVNIFSCSYAHENIFMLTHCVHENIFMIIDHENIFHVLIIIWLMIDEIIICSY